jgi:mono/diheme cytochrome c family protein
VRRWIWILIGLLLGAAAVGSRTLWAAAAEQGTDTPPTADAVTRGEYLVHAADCISCHTTPGSAPFAGGREFDLGSMGTLYSPNITPDRATGIGGWSDADFLAAMHRGVAPDGTHLYPVFPYTSYTLLSDADVLAIKAYLFSLKPVHAVTPPDAMHFPYNYRFMMGFWNLLFNPDKRFAADSTQSAAWNRGKYLVDGLGHCGECHTPRNFLQARKSSEAYAGALAQGWYAFNITSDAQTGIGSWSEADLRSYLASGHAAAHGSASGPMAEVVDNSLSRLTAEDVDAMVTYLRTIGPISTPEQRTASSAVAASTADLDYGSSLYAGMCANCHRVDGTGAETPYQTIQGAAALHDSRAINLTEVVLHGSALGTPYGPMRMPGFGAAYNNDELAAVIAYAAHQLGHTNVAVTAEEIAHRR